MENYTHICHMIVPKMDGLQPSNQIYWIDEQRPTTGDQETNNTTKVEEIKDQATNTSEMCDILHFYNCSFTFR